MEYILTNWQDIALAITATVTAASIIANLTPTDADNKIIAKIVRLLNLAGLNIKNNL